MEIQFNNKINIIVWKEMGKVNYLVKQYSVFFLVFWFLRQIFIPWWVWILININLWISCADKALNCFIILWQQIWMWYFIHNLQLFYPIIIFLKFFHCQDAVYNNISILNKFFLTGQYSREEGNVRFENDL